MISKNFYELSHALLRRPRQLFHRKEYGLILCLPFNGRIHPEIGGVGFYARRKFGPGGGLGCPRGGFRTGRSSGKATTTTYAKNHPQDHQNRHEDQN